MKMGVEIGGRWVEIRGAGEWNCGGGDRGRWMQMRCVERRWGSGNSGQVGADRGWK